MGQMEYYIIFGFINLILFGFFFCQFLKVFGKSDYWLFFSWQNGRISSLDFHKTSNFLVTASDDESIRLYDISNATSASHFLFLKLYN